MWLTADEAAEYLEDWLEDMLVEFLEAIDFGGGVSTTVHNLPDIVPSFNVAL